MKLQQLRYVVGVVDHGSMTRAAAVLHVAQPALSQGIRSLERELGTSLFSRVGRRVEPTPAGFVVAESGRRVLAEVDGLRGRAAAAAWSAEGHLDLAVREGLAIDPGMHLIQAVRRRRPDLKLRVTHAVDRDEVATLVRSGAADLGLTEEAELGEDLEAVIVSRSRVQVALPPGTRFASPSIGLEQLVRFPLVLPPPGDRRRDELETACDGLGVALKVAFETGDRDLQVELVLAGEGAAFVTGRKAHDAARAGAVVVDIQPATDREVVLLWRRDDRSTAADDFVVAATDEPALEAVG